VLSIFGGNARLLGREGTQSGHLSVRQTVCSKGRKEERPTRDGCICSSRGTLNHPSLAWWSCSEAGGRESGTPQRSEVTYVPPRPYSPTIGNCAKYQRSSIARPICRTQPFLPRSAAVSVRACPSPWCMPCMGDQRASTRFRHRDSSGRHGRDGRIPVWLLIFETSGWWRGLRQPLALSEHNRAQHPLGLEEPDYTGPAPAETRQPFTERTGLTARALTAPGRSIERPHGSSLAKQHDLAEEEIATPPTLASRDGSPIPDWAAVTLKPNPEPRQPPINRRSTHPQRCRDPRSVPTLLPADRNEPISVALDGRQRTRQDLGFYGRGTETNSFR
jgi:hypothetical protein